MGVKEAQRARTTWENAHMSPRWSILIKDTWPAYCKATREIASMKQSLAAADDPSRGVWPSIDALAVMGFLERPLEEIPRLTPLGVMATEVNEGHPILMSQAFHRGTFKELSAEEILSVLVSFAQEGDAEMPSVNSLDVPKEVRAALWRVHGLTEEFQRVENQVGAPRAPKNSYWELNTTWVEPMWRWLQGATVQELCADYGFYEGNLIRLLAKTVNLLEEWRSLATLAMDTAMLEKMRGLETRIMRDVAVCDSLYLRI